VLYNKEGAFPIYGDWPMVWVWIGEAQHLQQEPRGGGLQHTQAGHMGLLTAHQNTLHEFFNTRRKIYQFESFNLYIIL